MENKKLTTQEILARARQQKAAAAGESQAEAPKSEPAPAAPSEPAAEAAADEASAPAAPKAAPKPAGGAPKSTKDILAAARAAKGGGAAPAGGAPTSTADKLAAARAAAGKPAALKAEAAVAPVKGAAPAKPAGERPSVEEMLRAVREGKSAEAAVLKPDIVMPVKPVKPAPVAKSKPTEERRSVLKTLVVSPFALAWTLFTISSSVAGLAVARFMMPNVLVEPPSKFKVGPPSDYPPGVVSTKWTSQFGVWIVHNVYKGKDLIYALSTVCTHLGCTPNWLEGEQKFKCPCHGSGFYITGVNFEGPAPRPLERHGIRIAEDGMLEVDKSVKFQEEMGQWEDPGCFVPVA